MAVDAIEVYLIIRTPTLLSTIIIDSTPSTLTNTNLPLLIQHKSFMTFHTSMPRSIIISISRTVITLALIQHLIHSTALTPI